jgi:uncharacterized protein
MSEESKLLDEVMQCVKSIEPSAEILLFGSHARKSAGPDSDWDFLILLPGPVDEARKDRIRHRLYDIELARDAIISSLIIARDDWDSSRNRATPLYKQIQQEGVLVAR